MGNFADSIDKLTLEEKVAIVSGTDFMYTNPVPRLGIPSVRMSDGPHGLRVQKVGGDNGVNNSEQATSFPTAATTASSWNPDNTYRMGVAIAEEGLHNGIDVVLGPGACIKRNPLCGRNFEYFSEDPLLSGKMAAAEVNGIQSKGVASCVKHFALNNAENFRFMGDSICDMRAIREIYLKSFEIIVKESAPESMMCAYNKINGTYCCQNSWLLNEVLRKEWGFNGLVMSDWGATHDRVKGVCSGLDLEMPGDTLICRKWLFDAVTNGQLDEKVLDVAVQNVLKLVDKHHRHNTQEIDWQAHDTLARQIAQDSAVLLKNDNALPLYDCDKMLVVGELFEKMRYQGAGSSMINPYKVTTSKDAFVQANVDYHFVKGYEENKTEPNSRLIEEAVSAAKDFDKILLFVGLTDYVESEGCDRENMQLPSNQLALIQALSKTGKTVIIVMFGGSPVELPFADKVSAILNMYLPGQNGGTATYNLLFGKSNPCGKLAETWAKSYDDVPFGKDFSKTVNEIYKESVFVGYRYYLTAKKEVAYPFGFGLSYTTFDYANMTLEQKSDGYVVSCDVTNTGRYEGAEIIQLYTAAPNDGVFKPLRELKGFSKVYLMAGETRTIQIEVKKDDLRYWNVKENRWVLQGGQYIIQLCSDCQTVKLSQAVTVSGNDESACSDEINDIYNSVAFDSIADEVFEQMSGLSIPPPPSLIPITLESRFVDVQHSFLGRIIYSAVQSVAKKQLKEANKQPNGVEKDNKIKGAIFLSRILDSNSLMTLTMSGGRPMPYNFAEGFAAFGNGKVLLGAKCFLSKINAPKLPKDEN